LSYVIFVPLAFTNPVPFKAFCLAFNCVCIADVTPSTYPISVLVTLPIDVVLGRTTVPVKVGEANVA
jgi:hypothetical protein